MSAELPHTMLNTVLRIRAREYTESLYIGATVDANDWRYLEGTDWGRFLAEALADKGWALDGDVIVPLLQAAE